MPTTPYARIRIRANGGAPQTGAVEVSPGDTIQLDAESYDGWQAPVARWEWYSYPDGWTGPGGDWLEESIPRDDGTFATVYFWLGNTQPPSFTAPAIELWGKYLCRLIVNGGQRGGAPNAEMKDESTLMEIVSSNGYHDLAWLEGTQSGQEKRWSRDHQKNLRTLDGGVVSSSPYVGTPATVQSGTGSAGGSAQYAKGDHSHQLLPATLVAILGTVTTQISVNGQTVISGGYYAPFFSTTVTPRPTSGLLRASSSSILVSARNDGDTVDVSVLSYGDIGDDVLGIGDDSVAGLDINVASVAEIRTFAGGNRIHTLTRADGYKFADGANMSFQFDTSPVPTTGKDSVFIAQSGENTGGSLTLSAGDGSTPGLLKLRTRTAGDIAAEIQFVADATAHLSVGYDAVNTTSTLTQNGSVFNIQAAGINWLCTANMALFNSPLDYGGGTGVIYIKDAAVPPTTPPTGGVFLYAEGGELKAMASSGTVTTIAPL